MTILQTATATAGADTTSVSRKKRSYISLNGKMFTRMDCIGRGGSCRVYQVMAENFKLFALKRVSMQDLDQATVKGYKGEIDLLKRLSNSERVVRLIDYEVNDEKQTLSVLMEIGELDLARILKVRFQPDGPDAPNQSRLDLSFARHYWKEMLECVAAVHAHDIVHSDLKPANFLLVQGRLKLIDFGIANAIQDDTVNVHRDQTVGTPNYMAPEAIQDANAARGLPASMGKMMKLGKPSDVWSLGCILYQMCYGRPPFAVFARPVATIMAITNPDHAIEFPALGLGSVPVPAGLMSTMKACLQRDQTRRPTIDTLLSATDPWLYPDHAVTAAATAKGGSATVEITHETLEKILRNVVRYCQSGKVPDERELKEWPGLFMEKLKGREGVS
jgi:serine/threonine-protein kinase TTK/MPS1